MSTYVFVYGTLKEGFPNFGTNLGTRVAGSFVTAERYPLYLIGDRFVPCMVNTPGQGDRVVGQVFEVQAAVLQEMDRLERVNQPDGYERIEIDVAVPSREEPTSLTAFAYLIPAERLARLAIIAGPLTEYTRQHAARYRPRAPVGRCTSSNDQKWLHNP